MMNREEKLKIAEQWMKQLNMMPQCIEALKKGQVWQSESWGKMSGILYSAEPDVLEKVKEIETEQGVLVWHVIKGTYLLGGEKVNMTSFLLVGNEDTATMELPQCIDNSYAVFAYVQNKSWETGSEYGDVAVLPANGGLRRVG